MAQQMPMLDVDLRATCAVGLDGSMQRRSIRGQLFQFYAEAMCKVAASEGRHLDHWLFGRVLEQFARHPPKCKVGIFLGILGGLVELVVSERRNRLQAYWLSKIPGYRTSGGDVMSPNGSAWAYWDGQSLARVHNISTGEPSGLMVTEISEQGIEVLTNVSQTEWTAVAEHPVEMWNRCPIPKTFEESIAVADGSPVMVQHRWCRSDELRYLDMEIR